MEFGIYTCAGQEIITALKKWIVYLWLCKWVNTVGKYRQIVCVFGMSWMVTGFVYVDSSMWGQCEQWGAGR